ncbi:MAG: hypothetical protein WBP45_00015 [Daejeonella sp.]
MTNLKRSVISCIGFLLTYFAEPAINIACGPEIDPYDYYMQFFHNNILADKSYNAFRFIEEQFLYDDAEPEKESIVNAREWAAYLGKEVKTEDIIKVMYQLDTVADALVNLTPAKKRKTLPDSLKQNTFIQSLSKRKHKAALKYYQFAKSIEPLTNRKYNSWDYYGDWNAGKVSIDDFSTDPVEEALKQGHKTKDQFLKLRYFYQGARLAHYTFNYQKCITIYDQGIAKISSESHVKGWALALKAGAMRRLGAKMKTGDPLLADNNAKAAYLFSKVFDQYPERRIQAYINFYYEPADFENVLKFAANKHEQAVLWTIKGFKTSYLNLNYLQKVYELDPKSDMAGVLLIREINKLEAESAKMYPSNSLASIEYVTSINQLKAFCLKLTEDKIYPEYGIGYIAAAYLSWLQGNTKEGMEFLNKIETEKLGTALKDQQQITSLLLAAQGIKQYNALNEETLLSSLKWLDEKAENENKEEWNQVKEEKFNATARNFYQAILAPAYIKQGDTVKAALAMLKGDRLNRNTVKKDMNLLMSDETIEFWRNHLRSKQLKELILLKENNRQPPYLNFICNTLKFIKNDDLGELLGTAYLREHHYEQAFLTFNQIKQTFVRADEINDYFGYWQADAFYSQIKDYPINKGSKKYNKLEFAREMAETERKIKTDPKRSAEYYYHLATGMYNTSYYGNSWNLVSYSWSGFDWGRSLNYSYHPDYLEARTARLYYLKARELSKDLEFRAKCTFMIAKCYQKSFKPELNSSLNPQGDFYYFSIKNPYFKELELKYNNTTFFKKGVGECSYLKDFINRAR